jgi:hypothetical protein
VRLLAAELAEARFAAALSTDNGRERSGLLVVGTHPKPVQGETPPCMAANRYRVGVCSRFSNVNVHCSAHNWGYRAKEGYEYDCYYTIVIRLTATTIYRSQRNNHCDTH